MVAYQSSGTEAYFNAKLYISIRISPISYLGSLTTLEWIHSRLMTSCLLNCQLVLGLHSSSPLFDSALQSPSLKHMVQSQITSPKSSTVKINAKNPFSVVAISLSSFDKSFTPLSSNSSTAPLAGFLLLMYLKKLLLVLMFLAISPSLFYLLALPPLYICVAIFCALFCSTHYRRTKDTLLPFMASLASHPTCTHLTFCVPFLICGKHSS